MENAMTIFGELQWCEYGEHRDVYDVVFLKRNIVWRQIRHEIWLST